jgi:hypothetical protein
MMLHGRYQVQAEPESIGDIVISRFIASTFSSAQWSPPALALFLDLNVPVAFGYGSTDNIMPSHQGALMSTLADAPVPVYVIEGAWHMPFHIRGGVDFTNVITLAEQTAVVPGTHAKALAATLHTFPWTKYYSTFSLTQTLSAIERLYNALLEARKNIQADVATTACDASLAATIPSRIFSVSGETSVSLQGNPLHQFRCGSD